MAGSGPTGGEGDHGGHEWLGRLLAGRYRVESTLGSGGMGAVYLATDVRLSRKVVVKIPHAALLTEPGFRERFAREVSSLTRLEHPHVVQIHDVGEEDGVPFAVVQYLGGGDLGDRMDHQGTFLPDEVLDWLRTVAETLDHVFASGFVHRDIKPENILFDEHGNVFLSDFGIATALAASDPDKTVDRDSRLTRPGMFIGAATYAPPEALDRGLNPRYDQYSLAVTVYEALCGDVPFERAGWVDVMFAKTRRDPVPLRERAPEIPVGAAAAVMRALSRDPADRFESCAAFARAFEAGLARPAKASPGRPAALLALGAGAAVVLAAAAVWWWGRTQTLANPLIELAAAGPVRFDAGSTAGEVEAAYALCQQHVDACPDYADEHVRSVLIEPFAIQRHEVTNREFAAFVEATGYVTTAEREGSSFHHLRVAPGFDWREPLGPGSSWRERPEHPVVHVSWQDAEAYCRAQGMRLPDEDEWEFAARGEARRVFPWGDEWSDGLANWGRPREGGTRRVGAFSDGATPEGVVDLAGNVAEWTTGGDDRGRVYKGGSWFDTNPANLRAATRRVEEPSFSSSDLGFRCVESGTPAPPQGRLLDPPEAVVALLVSGNHAHPRHATALDPQ